MPEEQSQHNSSLHENPNLKNLSVGILQCLQCLSLKWTLSGKIHFTQYSAPRIPQEINTDSVSTDFCRALPQQVGREKVGHGKDRQWQQCSCENAG